MPDYEAVIGLETHIQLNSLSKIFCACKVDSWGDPPNTNICPVCTGLPGVLPVLNRAAVEKAVCLAAAVGAEIHDESYFARKNYFYPDLPKGYQISQYDEPLASGGSFELPLPDGTVRHVSIWKLHLEEDAGKTVHQGRRRLIDFNRCGVPLIEMVTGPDLRSADEAAQYLIRLRQLLRWLGISEADMERGQLRCDGNVSLRPAGSTILNPKTEIKNVNSIENLRAAIEAEIARQGRELDAGGTIQAWTLEWDEDTGTLRKMRSKETEADYRYFREPDLLPLYIDPAWRSTILAGLPELPLARRARFVTQYEIPPYDAEILTEERSLSDYFEKTVAILEGQAKAVSNWMMNDVRARGERGRLAPDPGRPGVDHRDGREAPDHHEHGEGLAPAGARLRSSPARDRRRRRSGPGLRRKRASGDGPRCAERERRAGRRLSGGEGHPSRLVCRSGHASIGRQSRSPEDAGRPGEDARGRRKLSGRSWPHPIRSNPSRSSDKPTAFVFESCTGRGTRIVWLSFCCTAWPPTPVSGNRSPDGWPPSGTRRTRRTCAVTANPTHRPAVTTSKRSPRTLPA
jgi:aspartyl-tRNA(Asn)/glutamyl-tRNA(Gln) amidotransferase subunit B